MFLIIVTPEFRIYCLFARLFCFVDDLKSLKSHFGDVVVLNDAKEGDTPKRPEPLKRCLWGGGANTQSSYYQSCAVKFSVHRKTQESHTSYPTSPQQRVSHNLSVSSFAEDRKVRCSICKSVSKSIFYLCKSGHHVICENCQHNEFITNRNDDGDYVPENHRSFNNRKKLSYQEMKPRDLSSGDHRSAVETFKNTEVNKSGLFPTSIPKEYCCKHKPTVTTIYRNDKFHDASITSSYVYASTQRVKEPTCDNISRPVTCPVTSCKKIVTIDSLSQHFNFDHSKVPRMILNRSVPQEISVNFTALSDETQCIATFVISATKRKNQTSLRRIASHTNIHSWNKDCLIVLLMTAKLVTGPVAFGDTKHPPGNSATKSCTMIENVRKRLNQTSNICNIKRQYENISRHKNDKDNNELILLWLCGLNDDSGIYSINISREDNQKGYIYIGEAVHIRNEQDPISIHTRAECLSVRRTAINKLLTAENELKIIVGAVQVNNK